MLRVKRAWAEPLAQPALQPRLRCAAAVGWQQLRHRRHRRRW